MIQSRSLWSIVRRPRPLEVEDCLGARESLRFVQAAGGGRLDWRPSPSSAAPRSWRPRAVSSGTPSGGAPRNQHGGATAALPGRHAVFPRAALLVICAPVSGWAVLRDGRPTHSPCVAPSPAADSAIRLPARPALGLLVPQQLLVHGRLQEPGEDVALHQVLHAPLGCVEQLAVGRRQPVLYRRPRGRVHIDLRRTETGSDGYQGRSEAVART